jgi:hypothetical protein
MGFLGIALVISDKGAGRGKPRAEATIRPARFHRIARSFSSENLLVFTGFVARFRRKSCSFSNGLLARFQPDLLLVFTGFVARFQPVHAGTQRPWRDRSFNHRSQKGMGGDYEQCCLYRLS